MQLFKLNEEYKDQIREVKKTNIRIDRKIDTKHFEIDNMIDLLGLDPDLKHNKGDNDRLGKSTSVKVIVGGAKQKL